MAPSFGQRHTESGVGSLIRASIRAATNKRPSVGMAQHQQQQRHLSRVAALPATEPRMELKAQAMPLYTDAPKPSKLFPKPTLGKPQEVPAQQASFRGGTLSGGTASIIGKQVSEDDARNNRSAREVLPKSRPTTASATLGGSHLKFVRLGIVLGRVSFGCAGYECGDWRGAVANDPKAEAACWAEWRRVAATSVCRRVS